MGSSREKLSLPRVLVIGTGGTVACIGTNRLDFTSYGESGKRLSIQEVVGLVPEASEFSHVEAEEFANTGSVDFSPADWVRLANLVNARLESAPGLEGVVITHGTATLEETAYFLHLTIRSERPVVLTGAMRPPSALSSDAPLNVLDALRVASTASSRGKGVLVVMNRQIGSAREVVKRRSSTPDGFKSDEMGFLGLIQADGRVVYYRAPVRRHTSHSELSKLYVGGLPRVDILYAYPGSDGALVEAATQYGAKGVVAVSLGSGSLPRAMHSALREAMKSGVVAVLGSRVAEGGVPGSATKKNEGFVLADTLPPQKARILLMLGLCVTREPEEIQRMFDEY